MEDTIPGEDPALLQHRAASVVLGDLLRIRASMLPSEDNGKRGARLSPPPPLYLPPGSTEQNATTSLHQSPSRESLTLKACVRTVKVQGRAVDIIDDVYGGSFWVETTQQGLRRRLLIHVQIFQCYSKRDTQRREGRIHEVEEAPLCDPSFLTGSTALPALVEPNL